MEAIGIHGGIRLQGKVRVQGSKNGALPVLAATLLTKGENLICNCPGITDIDQMLSLLVGLGCRIKREEGGIRIDASCTKCQTLTGDAVGGMRSSLFLMGPLLARCGKVIMEHPGGCVIGKRPVDMHLRALSEMGASFLEWDHRILGLAQNGLKGAVIRLPFPSVGATENVILAAVTAEGETHLYGAAREPEIEGLCEYLKMCGACITGAGSDHIRIKGVRELHGARYRVIPDRIVAGTYLLSCVGIGGSIYLKEAQASHMEAVTELAGCMGALCQEADNGLYIQMQGRPKLPPYVRTGPYPEFPTDLQSVYLAAACKGDGTCLVEETVFENRFRVVEALRRLGGDIHTVDANSVLVSGKETLTGASVKALELRGGAALVCAGLMAAGESKITGCEYIERGYENICRDYRELGARIYSV